MKGAFVQAQQLHHGWVGPEHVLLALLAEPNVASEVLSGLGVTYEQFKEHLEKLKPDPDIASPDARRGASINPAGDRLMGWASGFAVASGLPSSRSEHWLIAFLYASDRGAMWLRSFGVSPKAVTEALATRGVRVPEFPPPEYRPWREGKTVYVPKKELQPILDVLGEKHPPGSEWKWGFNLVGKPQRGRVHAEAGIDLDAVVAQARARSKARPKTTSSR
jgi:hypothetical protein